MSKRNTVLIIDALNMFLRSYTIIPSMNPQGLPNGGTVGFIKSLQMLCREMRPNEVIICWDGHGGSEKRRQLNKNYKQGRRPVRFNRRMIELPEDQVKKNRTDQQLRLHEFLNQMPVIQLMVDFVEADDIIAYVTQHDKYTEWDKIIVSSDKLSKIDLSSPTVFTSSNKFMLILVLFFIELIFSTIYYTINFVKLNDNVINKKLLKLMQYFEVLLIQNI